jgi:hypothetical protein
VVVACFDRFQLRIGALGEVRDEWLQGRDLFRNKTITKGILYREFIMLSWIRTIAPIDKIGPNDHFL